MAMAMGLIGGVIGGIGGAILMFWLALWAIDRFSRLESAGAAAEPAE